jgi:hypothetical protein
LKEGVAVTDRKPPAGQAAESETRKRPWKLPWWWNLILALMLAVGVVLIWKNWQVPQYLQRLSSRVQGDSWWRLFGIWLVSAPITHWIISRLLRWMSKLFVLEDQDNEEQDAVANLWSPALLGISETIMYPLAILKGKPEFIGL